MSMVIFGVLLIAAGVVAAVSYFGTDVYQDESEFEEYVSGELKTSDNVIMVKNGETSYEYGEPLSYAVENGKCENEVITSFRDQKIKEIKAEYAKRIESEQASQDEDDDSDVKEHALIMRTGVYESEKGIESLIIFVSENSAHKKEMANDDSYVYTYHFLTETGNQMVQQQIFADGYRSTCSEYFTKYFRSNYKDEELAKNWEDFLSAGETNFNEFALTDKGVTFFFDDGTVLKKGSGSVAVGISNAEMGSVLREEPLKRYIDPSKPMVALTYDDGPGGESETRILNCLKKNGGVATFFYLGNRVSGGSENVKTAYNMGCQIGSHTWNHPKLTSLTSAQVQKQFSDTNAAVRAVTGENPTAFRPSYGITNDSINKMSGMPVIMWTVDTLDWKYRDGQKVFDAVKKEGNLDGKIILMHSIHDTTADATDLIVPWLRENGYQMVTVNELIKYKTGQEPQAGKVYRTF